MLEHPCNPETNVLAAGLSEDALGEAIDKSGYPLQSLAVDLIINELPEGNPAFLQLQEEWSYLDGDTGQVRQLDAYVSVTVNSHLIPVHPEEPADYLRTRVDLLVECKQSDLPFVFFVRDGLHCSSPMVTGFPHGDDLSISIGSSDDDVQIGMSYSDALALFDLEFTKPHFSAVNLSKARRKNGGGGAIELSGEDVFRGIALPLQKAQAHYLDLVKPAPTHLFHDIRLIAPIAVLRAPMVAVTMKDGERELHSVPWVRVTQPDPNVSFFGSPYFDAVHIDYLSTYTRLLVETAQEIDARVREFAIQIITGEGVSTNGESARPYEDLAPKMSRQEFDDWMANRWQEVHAPLSESESPALRTSRRT